jgi:hypothetical protein
LCQKLTNAPQQIRAYSITSSARARSVGGTSIQSAFAAATLMTSSNLVGCSTGNRYSFMVQIIVAWFSFFLTRRSCVVTQRLLPKVQLRSTPIALPASLS